MPAQKTSVGAPPGGVDHSAIDAPKPAATKVLLVPLQPIFRAVPENKATHLTDLLMKELSTSEALVVLRAGVSATAPAEIEPSSTDALLRDAETKEAARAIDQAIDLRRQVIGSMIKHAEMAHRADDFILAHHLLGRALMWAGRDDEAQAVLLDAARMNPSLALPKDRYSRLYRRWFSRASTRVLAEDRGELLVRAVLPGAQIGLDGRAMGVAPVLIKEAIPGRHFMTAEVEGARPFAAIVEISPKRRTEFTATFGATLGGPAIGPVSDGVAENRLTREIVEAASTAGESAGASFVVLGGVTKDDARIYVHPFVVRVTDKSTSAIERVGFDLDLLTAESDVLRVARGVNDRVARWSNATPSVEAIDPRAIRVALVTEVSALSSARGPAEMGRGKTGQERVIFRPLKGGTVRIKDEED